MRKSASRSMKGSKGKSQREADEQHKKRSSVREDGNASQLLPRLDSGFGEAAFNSHVDLLGSRLMSHPAHSGEKAAVVQQLQRQYGNYYVQRVVERITGKGSGSQAVVQRKITGSNERDMEYFFGSKAEAIKFLNFLGEEKAWKEIDRFLKASKNKNKPSLQEIADYYDVEVEEPTVEDEGLDDEEIYTHSDGHEGKHLKLSSNSIKALEKMTREGSAATFKGVWATNYNAKLAEVIEAAAPTNTPYIDCGETVGVDAGEETDWVELYYGGVIGSHMRPKAGSQVKGKTVTL